MSQQQLYFQNQQESYQQHNKLINQQNQQFFQSNQSKNRKLKIQDIQAQSKGNEILKNNIKNQEQNINSNDMGNQNQSAVKRKNRRKKVDDDGRDYTCSCGKSYLSYPALYTHVKTKHNGQLSMLTDPQSKYHNLNNQPKLQQSSLIQNTLNSLNYNNHYPGNSTNPNKSLQPYPNDSQYHQSKKSTQNALIKPLTTTQQTDQQIINIQKLKQFIYKQFVKDKSNQSLLQMKNSLRLNDQQVRYIKNIIHQAEEINDKDSFVNKINFSLEGSNKMSSKMQKEAGKNQEERDKSESLKLKENQDQNNVASNSNGLMEFNSPIRRSTLTNKSALASIPLHISSSNSNLHNSINNSSSNKLQKKGFSSYVRLAHQNALLKKQNREEQNFYIEEIFGIFLSQVFRTSSNAYYHHELVNLMCVNFICRIRQYFNKKLLNPAQKQTQLLIQQANDLIQYFVQINENKYLKQPVAICKIMFFFYRWLYMAKFTNKYVKFNQVGGTNRYNY